MRVYMASLGAADWVHAANSMLEITPAIAAGTSEPQFRHAAEMDWHLRRLAPDIPMVTLASLIGSPSVNNLVTHGSFASLWRQGGSLLAFPRSRDEIVQRGDPVEILALVSGHLNAITLAKVSRSCPWTSPEAPSTSASAPSASSSALRTPLSCLPWTCWSLLQRAHPCTPSSSGPWHPSLRADAVWKR